MDIAEALTKTKNPRKYWNTIKTRKNELSSICRQLKLKAKDGKLYNTDVIDENGLNTVLTLIPSKKADVFAKRMKNAGTSLDEKSKQKAYFIPTQNTGMTAWNTLIVYMKSIPTKMITMER